mmetsp:Transcript_24536/g.53082  ORF Transcript_24536/g.53082 Transcript_24536/m.53082 type:complete len:274 (+) Transcript_24536:296-1117(+)
MLPHHPIPMKFKRPRIVTRPRRIAMPLPALVPLPLQHSRHALGQEHVLILRIVRPSVTDDGTLDDELPPALLGEVLGVGGVVEGHLQSHVGCEGVGAGHPAHEGIAPRFSRLALILEGDDPRRFLGEGGLSGPLGLFLSNGHPLFGPVGIQRNLIHVCRIEGCHLGLVIREHRFGERGGDGEYRVRVEGVQFLFVFLDFRLLILEVGLAFVVFRIVIGDGEGFGRGGFARGLCGGGGGEGSACHSCELQRGEGALGAACEECGGRHGRDGVPA